MSDAVERRILALLDKPLVCPHGNPIPGLEELGLPFASIADSSLLPTLSAAAASGDEVTVIIERISEQLQPNAALMRQLSAAGLTPQHSVTATRVSGGLRIQGGQESTTLPHSVADGIFVSLPA
jgi:DtxR family Mn-dependent transcriptional regulator